MLIIPVNGRYRPPAFTPLLISLHLTCLCPALAMPTHSTPEVEPSEVNPSGLFRCEPCDKTFAAKRRLTTHNYDVHPTGFFFSQCGKQWPIATADEGRLYCPIDGCENTLASMRTLSSHMKGIHGIAKGKPSATSEPTPTPAPAPAPQPAPHSSAQPTPMSSGSVPHDQCK